MFNIAEKKLLLPQPNFLDGALNCSTIKLNKKEKPQKCISRATSNNIDNTKKEKHKSQKLEERFCDACEMQFESNDCFLEHCSQHTLCRNENCTYMLHPTAMDKHVRIFHSGLLDKVKKLSTPEEIAAWRKERCEKYPTLRNIQLKEKAEEQRLRRGERLNDKKCRFLSRTDRKRLQNGNMPMGKNEVNKVKTEKRHQKHKNKPKVGQVNEVKQLHLERFNKSEEIENKCGDVVMFTGTSKLHNYSHSVSNTNKGSNILSTLLGMYHSEDESIEHSSSDYEMDEEHIHNSTKTSTDKLQIKNDCNNMADKTLILNSCKESTSCIESLTNQKRINENKNYSSDKQLTSDTDDAPDEIPISHSCNGTNLPTNLIPSKVQKKDEDLCLTSISRMTRTPVNQKKFKRKIGLDYRKLKATKPNTLLGKLLESEVRHERNILLQCIRFVCDNNFFDLK
ncbi:uncharacterized protein LOC119677554 isoform X2 [Teleopsis dalmanni]|uniref:uncharacterized protein LOC119677554 isoform X2 n=1 Tax=Teleopsis dalmanni TaxID=139649 RepID=UPI0018CE43F9|nr:uncharacterized protein LOC119677554 isoform X2 [Teleopsis dalmanni]